MWDATGTIEEVDQIAAEVARDIRSQYTIGYHSTKPASVPGFRKVELTVEAKRLGKLTVRTRTGYFPAVRPVSHAPVPDWKTDDRRARQTAARRSSK